VAQRYPREITGLERFRRYDTVVPPLVGLYAFAQLVAAVLLLDFMQKTTLAYWSGVGLWALLLAGMVTTAWWLEGRDSTRLLRWELLRLAALAALLLAGWSLGTGTGLLLAGVAYAALNLLFLFLLLRRGVASGPVHAH